METRYPLDFQPRHNLSFRVILPVPGRKASIHVQQYNWWIYSWCVFVKTYSISKWFHVFSMLLTSKCTGRYDWHQYFPTVTVDDSESVAKLLPKSVMDIIYAWLYITLHFEVSCHCISASPLLVHNQSASPLSHTVNPQLLSMVISVIQPMARANRSPSHALPFEILYHLHQLQEISMKCLLTNHYSSWRPNNGSANNHDSFGLSSSRGLWAQRSVQMLNKVCRATTQIYTPNTGERTIYKFLPQFLFILMRVFTICWIVHAWIHK